MGDNLVEVKHCGINVLHTWRYNWNTASSSNGSAQLKMENTRFSGVSRLQTQGHHFLAPGGTKSTDRLFMWPREKLDITVLEGGNLTNNNVVECTLLSRSILTASSSRKKNVLLNKETCPLYLMPPPVPRTQSQLTSQQWINQPPNTTVFTNFWFWNHPFWKSWPESYRNTVLGETSRE